MIIRCGTVAEGEIGGSFSIGGAGGAFKINDIVESSSARARSWVRVG